MARAAVQRSDGRPLTRAALGLQPDDVLVELARRGRDDAFAAIVERYRRPLIRYSARTIGHVRAEDVVQQAFLSLLTRLRDDDRDLFLRAWLYRVAHNLTLNDLRRRGYDHEELDEGFDGVPQPGHLAAVRARLRDAVAHIGRLPERQRVALVRRELEGASCEQIAAELGTSSTAVRQLISRARTALRDGVGLLLPLPVLRLGEGAGTAAASAAPALGGGSLAVGAAAKLGCTALVVTAVGSTGVGLKPDDAADSARARAAQTATTSVEATPRRSGAVAVALPARLSTDAARAAPREDEGMGVSAAPAPDGAAEDSHPTPEPDDDAPGAEAAPEDPTAAEADEPEEAPMPGDESPTDLEEEPPAEGDEAVWEAATEATVDEGGDPAARPRPVEPAGPGDGDLAASTAA